MIIWSYAKSPYCTLIQISFKIELIRTAKTKECLEHAFQMSETKATKLRSFLMEIIEFFHTYDDYGHSIDV